MVERVVVDHVSYTCHKCGHDHVMDVTVPVLCPTCESPTPYYLAEEWFHGAALTLYRKRKTDAAPVLICVFTEGGATLSPEARERAEMMLDLLTYVEIDR